jgi:hypothetical protein
MSLRPAQSNTARSAASRPSNFAEFENAAKQITELGGGIKGFYFSGKREIPECGVRYRAFVRQTKRASPHDERNGHPLSMSGSYQIERSGTSGGRGSVRCRE